MGRGLDSLQADHIEKISPVAQCLEQLSSKMCLVDFIYQIASMKSQTFPVWLFFASPGDSRLPKPSFFVIIGLRAMLLALLGLLFEVEI